MPTAPLIIDWHAHWIPPEVIALLTKRTEPPRIIAGRVGRLLDPGDGRMLPLKEPQLDLDRRRDEMDRAGVNKQILSLAVVAGIFPACLPPDVEQAVAEATNRGLARLTRDSGGRFGGLAALPSGAPNLAAKMLEEAVEEHGLEGGVLPADAFADETTASTLTPVLAAAHRLRTQIFVHPGPLSGSPLPSSGDDPLAMIRRRAVGFQDALTQAAITLEYSDTLAPYPDAVVRIANLGGTLALLAERIALTADRMGLPPAWADGRPRRILVDTASFGENGIALAAQTLGTDRLIYGSDSPALPLHPGLDGLHAAIPNESDRAAILSGRALG
ncbi:amidohydrolase family protein [Magnetospirillum molischianum]|uniref:Putative Aminocarboxymuconate-semialdehyde decarboxylase n=1 Tax=Magnetospirillum molischianum DSM 120 TaxID=1150626 RepID=H8FPH6_MAGML|nr:amidohydrolase family protein [Magnetospirillum molischianum]CCG40264.1 putative Aminocarboxymuconate-semialdehyde decarboxylase [Magnetospirillum molischianum DSM 120]